MTSSIHSDGLRYELLYHVLNDMKRAPVPELVHRSILSSATDEVVADEGIARMNEAFHWVRESHEEYMCVSMERVGRFAFSLAAQCPIRSLVILTFDSTGCDTSVEAIIEMHQYQKVCVMI